MFKNSGQQPIKEPITELIRYPKPIPINPPTTLNMVDSIRNCIRISIPLPPIDIRRPISRVRSVTDTYMIFMIPIPPTRREIPAIAPKRVVRISLMEEKVLISSDCDITLKSSSSGLACQTNFGKAQNFLIRKNPAALDRNFFDAKILNVAPVN